MTEPSEALREAFIEDHQVLTRGLAKIRDALRRGAPAGAEGKRVAAPAELVRLADELDLAAGPHVEFEERCLYPELRRELGDAFVDRLYHEHRAGRAAIARLRASETERPGATELAEVASWIDEAIEHVTSCGTLISHLDALEPARQRRLLDELVAFRDRGSRWTELDEDAEQV